MQFDLREKPPVSQTRASLRTFPNRRPSLAGLCTLIQPLGPFFQPIAFGPAGALAIKALGTPLLDVRVATCVAAGSLSHPRPVVRA